MRRTPAALLVSLTLLVSGLGAAWQPASATPAGPAPRADGDISPLPAVAADSLVDSYGVGIHLNFLDTPYLNYSAVASALANLGVRHVRDDVSLANLAHERAAMQAVADEGIRFDLIMGRPGTGDTPGDYVRTVANDLPVGAVESLEGVNEWDLKGGDDWVAEMKSWQQQLYAAAKSTPATADLPVLSPALAFRQNYATAGDMSQDADVANAHMYPGGQPPSNQIPQITAAVRGSIPDKPLVTTEAGYHNALKSSGGHLPVPEDVAGVYTPRLLLEHVLRGEQRVYTYELIDEFADSGLTNAEAHFGLLRRDLSPKPAYTAMRNLLGLLADPGAAFAPGSLAVAVDGYPPDARYLLTQKSDGTYVLLLWRDVSIYDPKAQQATPVTPVDVTVRLAVASDLAVYRPSDGAAPVTRTQDTSLALPLDGEVTAVVIDPAEPPDPTAVTATSGKGSATVTWQLPPTDAALTGFEIERSPGGLVHVADPAERSFQDTGLTNGTTYTYTVRAAAAEGQSAQVAAAPVVPATVPTAPGIGSVRARAHRIRVTWHPSDGRGRPVLGYRIMCAGRVLNVGPGRRRAVLKGLRPHHRYRVEIRAFNEIGPSRSARTPYLWTRG